MMTHTGPFAGLSWGLLLLLLQAAKAVDYTISSCADFSSVDEETATSLTFTSGSIVCDSYTVFRVRNDLIITATSGIEQLELSNFRLKVFEEVYVVPNVIFKDVYMQESNGGALKVLEGAAATFMGMAEFRNNSIVNTGHYIVNSDGEEVARAKRRRGAAVQNKGQLTFEGDAIFTENVVWDLGYSFPGITLGGALMNTARGSIIFNGRLSMELNKADNVDAESEGGAIYNRGDIYVAGESSFVDNTGGFGGAIYQRTWGTLTFAGKANFTSNDGDHTGGALYNEGGQISFMSDSVFDQNRARGGYSGETPGGAVYTADGGEVTFAGMTEFTNNVAYTGGAAWSSDDSSLVFPEDEADYLFEGNNAKGGDDLCDNVAYITDDGDKMCWP